jgi:hypothetical protein
MMAHSIEAKTGIATEVSEIVNAMRTMLEKSMVVVYARGIGFEPDGKVSRFACFQDSVPG